ncbi:MAG: hypothetical protein ABIL09_12780 [Gemmatimonadota bacterium]
MNASTGRNGLYAMAGIAFLAVGYALGQGFFVALGLASLGFIAFQWLRDHTGKPDDG